MMGRNRFGMNAAHRPGQRRALMVREQLRVGGVLLAVDTDRCRGGACRLRLGAITIDPSDTCPRIQAPLIP